MALGALLAFVVFMVVSILVFRAKNAQFNKNNPDVITWLKNYKIGCKKDLELTYALQNASLSGCGYLTALTFCFVGSIYRCCGEHYVEGAWSNDPRKDRTCCQTFELVFMRVLIVVALVGWLGVPAIFVKIDMVGGSAELIMLVNIVLPLAIGSILLCAGPYDALAACADNCIIGKTPGDIELYEQDN